MSDSGNPICLVQCSDYAAHTSVTELFTVAQTSRSVKRWFAGSMYENLVSSFAEALWILLQWRRKPLLFKKAGTVWQELFVCVIMYECWQIFDHGLMSDTFVSMPFCLWELLSSDNTRRYILRVFQVSTKAENTCSDGQELVELAIGRCIDDVMNSTFLRCHCLSDIFCVVTAIVTSSVLKSTLISVHVGHWVSDCNHVGLCNHNCEVWSCCADKPRVSRSAGISDDGT